MRWWTSLAFFWHCLTPVSLSPLRSLTFLDASQNQLRALESLTQRDCHLVRLGTSSAIFGSQFWRPSLRWSLRPLRVLLLNGMRLR